MTKKFSYCACLLFLMLYLNLCSFAAADITVYNNFGPNYSYDTVTGWLLGGSDAATTQVVAMQFTPFSTVHLKQIDLAAGWISGTNSLTLELALDNNNKPGSTLESWTLVLGNVGVNNPPVTALSILTPQLNSGTMYDVVAIAASDESASWNWNNQNDVGPFIVSDDGSNWFTTQGHRGAYDVIGTIPEPGTLLMIGSGIFGLAGVLRRKINL